MKIVIIGAGPGGYEAAIYAAKKGAEVVLIEKDEVGGTCLNRGCIPTKAFLASSDVLDAVDKAGKFGIQIEGDRTIVYPEIVARKNKVMGSLVKGIGALLKANGVTVIKGMGSLVDEHTVKVVQEDDSEQMIAADAVILATGSNPVCPPVFKVDRKRVITSDEILDMEQAPESLIIAGGGVIGCEIGQFLATMGTKVTIVEALDSLLANMDTDVSKQLGRQFKKDKIKAITSDSIVSVEADDQHVGVTLASGKALEADYLLVAVGRGANTAGLGLETVGVQTDEKGRVVVNPSLQTSVENIYAIGDIINTPMLAHVAGKEGCIAVDNIFGEAKQAFYHAVPSCVFTNPEIAAVGQMEWQLKQAGISDYKVGTFEMKSLGKAQASGHIAGFVKVIANAEDVLIGAEIVGDRAADMLQVLTTAIQLRLTVSQLSESIFPHPTMCEAVMEALHDVHGMSIHKL
jgi:dihydrolipoamide dehydrogenase